MIAPTSRTRVFLSAGAALIFLGSACGHTGEPVPPAQPSSVSVSAPTARQEGDVAVRFLADPSAPKPKLLQTEEFAPANPRFTPLPAFPPAALQPGVPSSTVAVRLLINETGSVYGVTDSPRMASTVGPFSQEFRQVVESAVRRWSFSAARIDAVGEHVSGQNPSDPKPLLSTRYVPTFLDFAFQFTVSEGRGIVSVGPSSPASSPTQ